MRRRTPVGQVTGLMLALIMVFGGPLAMWLFGDRPVVVPMVVAPAVAVLLVAVGIALAAAHLDPQ